MRNAVFAWVGVAFLLALAAPPAPAQSNPPPGAVSAADIPRTGAGAGSNAARTRHRNTLNRQRARLTFQTDRSCKTPVPCQKEVKFKVGKFYIQNALLF